MDISAEEAMRLIQAAESMTPEQILKLQNERLHKLVDYAREHSPAYAELYRGLPKDYHTADLPSTDKKSLMGAGYEKWWTDHDIRREDAAAYLARDPETRGSFMGKYTMLTTSGTTGEPLMMVRDGHRNAIHGAILQSRLFAAIGDLLDFSKHRNAALVLDDPRISSYSSFLRRQKSRPGFEQNMLCVPVRLSTEEKVRRLNEFQPELITGYPSEALLMAIQQKKGLLHIAPKAFVCSAEMLTREMYQTLREAFNNCAVLNNYCMTEGGEAACMARCPHLHVNADWIILEPVDENKKLITDGETWSKGVFVTDLSNFVQPIIRYYIEDSVRIRPSDCEVSRFPQIEIKGRVSPIRQICGCDVPQQLLEHALELMDGVVLYQFVQTGPDSLEVRGVLAEDAEPDKVLRELLETVRKALAEAGCGACRLSWSDEPPVRNARGGKLSLYVVQ